MLSKNDLNVESNIMKHCVGHFGYDIKSYNNRSRIYTIIDKNNIRKGTMELVISDNRVSLDQIYDYKNRSVEIEVLDLSHKLVSLINNNDIKVDWKRFHKKTPTGKLLFSQPSKGNENVSSRTVEEVCGYDFRDITLIRAAAEPWRDVLPKNLKSMNKKEYAKIPEIQNIIKNVKSMMPDN